jgi:hypothetical protein
MSPAQILFFIFLFALIPFLAGAFLLAILAVFDEQINFEDTDETD